MEISHTELTPAFSEVMQEVFLPTDDVTITIDPIRRDQWIYDSDGTNAQKLGATRGLEFDRRAYYESLNWYKSHHDEVQLFQPTVSQLDGLDKYAAPVGSDCLGWRKYQRTETRFGRLPVISQAMYDGRYINKATGDIEHEQREAERRAAGRLFDRSGYTR